VASNRSTDRRNPIVPKTWLITGSSRGLGRHLAQAILAGGGTLVATARHPEQLDDKALARYLASM
jgi:NAD(P)-dependent dehydrogenase (short-subunit alcohol dehydrogenase family)